ncbi:MAG: hypothetical protein Q8914_01890 [Bacteroidota bacterium]|nr:hypothetical protein [Bacteroidota bacterium]
MKKWMISLLFVYPLLHSGPLEAQVLASDVFTVNVQDVCLIRLNPVTTINMSMLASVAGQSMDAVSNSSIYLQITSIAPTSQTRKIAVIISAGTVPAGTLLKLTPGTCTSGAGTRGNPSSTITLNKTANQTLIDGIGSCYTGTATGSGFNLTYTWQVDQANYALLKSVASTPIVVTFTISSI